MERARGKGIVKNNKQIALLFISQLFLFLLFVRLIALCSTLQETCLINLQELELCV